MDKKFIPLTEEMRHKILTIVGIVLCALLTPILIINCIMIIQSLVDQDKVPSVFGVSPMIVLTESMDPTIKAGDIILVKEIDAEDIAVGDVICFFPSNSEKTTTHRVIDIDDSTGVLKFQTQGDNNNIEDDLWVPEQNIVGIWTGTRIPVVGHVAMFMQSQYGLIICILVPLTLLVGYELYRRKRESEGAQSDIQDEIAMLKQALAEAQAAKAMETAVEEEKAENPVAEEGVEEQSTQEEAPVEIQEEVSPENKENE